MLVAQWCFAAVSTIAPTQHIETIEIFDRDKAATKVLAETRKLAARWFRDLERRLEECRWIAPRLFATGKAMSACAPTSGWMRSTNPGGLDADGRRA